MRLLVLADTHLTGSTLDRMPDEVWQRADDADVILHAGDVLDPAVLAALAERAPVHAVLGNNDRQLRGRLPELLQVELGGVLVGMIHDSGDRGGPRSADGAEVPRRRGRRVRAQPRAVHRAGPGWAAPREPRFADAASP